MVDVVIIVVVIVVVAIVVADVVAAVAVLIVFDVRIIGYLMEESGPEGAAGVTWNELVTRRHRQRRSHERRQKLSFNRVVLGVCFFFMGRKTESDGIVIGKYIYDK